MADGSPGSAAGAISTAADIIMLTDQAVDTLRAMAMPDIMEALTEEDTGFSQTPPDMSKMLSFGVFL